MAHDIDGPEPGGDPGADLPIAEAAAAAGAALACLSCGAAIVGPFCATCGQKNDDLRRSSLILFRDFLKDTFGFDARMWKTLGLMAAAPGLVPSNYSHGKRSRYTPPVRLFLVVSFLFFLTLGLTQTLFIAVEVTKKDAAQIAREEMARAKARAELEDAVSDEALIAIDGAEIDCAINVRARFFVRPDDVAVDQEAWRRCADSIRSAARIEIDEGAGGAAAAASETEKTVTAFNRALGGVGAAIEDPRAFNADVNKWLPRMMFVMAPALALLLGLFIRGRDALLFDHLVLSLYSHAAAFAIVGAAIVGAQLGLAHTGAAAAAALALYFVGAMKRAYGRGWVKTLLSAAFVGLFYFLILSSAVMSIVLNVVWRGA